MTKLIEFILEHDIFTLFVGGISLYYLGISLIFFFFGEGKRCLKMIIWFIAFWILWILPLLIYPILRPPFIISFYDGLLFIVMYVLWLLISYVYSDAKSI